MIRQYLMKVYLVGYEREIYRNVEVYRNIEMCGDGTLDQLCRIILQAFEVSSGLDYRFYIDNRMWSHEFDQEFESSTLKITIDELGFYEGQKFSLYYGSFMDDWMFTITVSKISEVPKKEDPRIIESKGNIYWHRSWYDDFSYDDSADLVKKYLVRNGIHFSFDEEKRIFDFCLNIKSKISKINCIIEADKYEEDIIIYAVCPIGVERGNVDMMGQMAEFLCRVNYGLRNGCFEFCFYNGEIRFRSHIDCDNSLSSLAVIDNSFRYIVRMYKDYSQGILDIILAGCKAKEAFMKCNKSWSREFHSIVD